MAPATTAVPRSLHAVIGHASGRRHAPRGAFLASRGKHMRKLPAPGASRPSPLSAAAEFGGRLVGNGGSSIGGVPRLPRPDPRSRAPPVSAVSGAASVGAGGAPLSEALKGVSIFRSDGASVPILSLWEDRKAVVAWVRHYGCLLCRKRAALLAERKAELDAAGVALALIGPASVDQAATFLEQTGFPGEVYADPDHRSFEALEFAFGPGTVLNPKAGLNLLEATAEGYRQDWGLSLREGTVSRGGWQQGGILVLGPGPDAVQFVHKDKEAGDEPDMRDVLEACCGVLSAT